MENKQSKITYGEFTKLFPEGTGFIREAGEDIPGFYKKGSSVYGNCDDLIVLEASIFGKDIIKVTLGNK